MKKIFGTKQIILIIILTIAAFFRLWNLGSVPPSVSIDEASIGYNAYSVLKAGGDEYGELPILSHRAYDDWRRATYLYLTSPFIALFGLNAVSIRLPAAILSIITVWATYNIVLSLFSKNSAFSPKIALTTAFLLAISPWHIYISRLGHESNTYLSFFVIGVLFFLQGEKNKSKSRLLLSVLFFAMSLVSYYAGQVFIPLFVVSLFFIFRKSLLSIFGFSKKTFVILFIFFILLIPIFRGVFSQDALIRFQGTSIFRPEAHWQRQELQKELRIKAIENKDIIARILNSKYLFPFQVFKEGYTSHFRPEWLISNSLAEPFKIPRMGLLYAWEIPLIIIGIIFLFFNSMIDSREKKLIFSWFFLSPLPAAIATQAPHAMRSYSFLPIWQIFAAVGLVYLFHKLKKLNIVILFAFVFCALINLSALYKNYFIVFPWEQSASFHYALSKTIPYVLSQQNKYRKVVFSNTENLYQSYMLFLYYSRYDPLLYQKQGGTKSGGYAQTHSFGKFEFKPLNNVVAQENTLYIWDINESNRNLNVIRSFSNLDGKEAILVGKKI